VIKSEGKGQKAEVRNAASRTIHLVNRRSAFARPFLTSAFCLLPFAFPAPLHAQAAPEVVAAVRVQSNQIAGDAEIIALAGVTVGAPVTPTLFADITKRLLDSKKFDGVQVLKRFASISDPAQVVVLIVVDEGPMHLDVPKDAGAPVKVVKRGFLDNFMWIPIVIGEDGYALSFGARIAIVNFAGPRNRLSFPMTYGGFKQAAAEFDRTFVKGPLTRIKVGTGVMSSQNPAFEIDDNRVRAGVQAERAFGHVLLGVVGGWQRVSFDTDRDDLGTVRGTISYDTRIDPAFPRNAAYLTASVERIAFAKQPSEAGTSGPITRTRLEGQGYFGFVGQTVVMIRALREDANRLQPRYLQSILGGWTTLRGFPAGSYTGDTLLSGSVELRLPISSPQAFIKWGLNGFVDNGTIYRADQSFSGAAFHTGAGGGVWFAAARIQFSVAVAHGLGGHGNHVNFDGGINF
jgi:outer membrane protein assembly factor BamA